MRMRKSGLRLSSEIRAKTSAAAYGGIKLAALFEMSDIEFEKVLKEVEGHPLFKFLMKTSVISVSKVDKAQISAVRFAELNLKRPSENGADVLGLDSDCVSLIRKIGEENFKKYFLENSGESINTISAGCGISSQEAKKLIDFVNEAFIKAEFENKKQCAPDKYFSLVAGIGVENGKPHLVFFRREIWKNIYRINEKNLAGYLSALPAKEKRRVNSLLNKVKFVEKRKTTLYRLLELLLKIQKKYFLSGDALDLKPLSQKRVSEELEVNPSVLSRMVSNKSVELPWGIQIPLSGLIPSPKKVNKERLSSIIEKTPLAGDAELQRKMSEIYRVELSRRSINQYRNELG